MLQALARQADHTRDEARFFNSFGSFLFDGHRYPFNYQLVGSKPEQVDPTFEGYIEQIHRQSSPVASAVVARALLMSQLRFAYRRDFSAGARQGELWGDRSLSILERPGSTTRASLLFAAEVDASYSGTAYITRDGNRLRRLMPNHVTVMLGSDSEPEWDGNVMRVPYDAEVVAYLYHPGGAWDNAQRTTVFFPDEVCAWSPEPDPIHFWRGTSWVTTVVREVVADLQATDHQQRFFENAATPSLVFTMDTDDVSRIEAFRDVIQRSHSGALNAYKNLFLGGGADVKVVGSTLESLNLKDITGGFETRVASRARVPGVVLQIRESYSGSTLNTGNYGAARRLFADSWFTPTAEAFCEALETIVPVPSGSRLSYRPDQILFLQEDQADAANIDATIAQAIRTLADGGFDPDSAVAALAPRWSSKLRHTGLPSVQLQPKEQSASAEPAAVERRAAEPEQMRLELHNHTHVTRSDVTVEPAQVTVEPANVHVDAPQIDVHVPEQRAEAPVVQVNVDPTPVNITNEIDVEPTPVEVRNQVDVNTPPAQVTVVGDDRKSKFRVRRDGKGQITEVTED